MELDSNRIRRKSKRFGPIQIGRPFDPTNRAEPLNESRLAMGSFQARPDPANCAWLNAKLPRCELLAPVTLLACGGAPAMGGRASVLRAGLRGGRFPLGSMLCRRDFCGRVLFVSGIAHCRGGMCFVMTLGGLLFLFFFLGRFLDAAEFPQNFFSLLGGLPAAGELHGEDLFDNLVELCST